MAREITLQEVETIEDKLIDVLSENDAYLVRKYSNQQRREIVRGVINRNPEHQKLINEVYFSWAELFQNQ